MPVLNPVKILKRTAGAVLVGGYGVIFGGEDLYKDTFTEDTDLMLDMVPVKKILYQHGQLKDIDHFIGKSTNEILRKAGLWVEAQLELHQEYVEEILELIDQKAIGWSSQAAGSLVKYADDWKTILRWPIVEYSLTPTPAEPRTIGVERLRALAGANPGLKALMPNISRQNTYIQLRARIAIALN